jgi:anti-sigma factor RsiW
MSDKWTDRLSEYLDGDLTSSEQDQVAAHLEECPECSATLAELRRVVGQAQALDDRAPKTDLWPGIAASIGATPPARTEPAADEIDVVPLRLRRLSFSIPQLLAAGIGLVMISGGVSWFARDAETGAEIAVTDPAGATEAAVDVWNTGLGETRYDQAVADLVRALEEERELLDSSTVRILEENLLIIDHALERARQALAEDPQSEYLSQHLERTMRRKLMLLQRVAAITARS